MGPVMATQTIQAATAKAITPQSIYLRKSVFANRDDIKKLMDEYGVCNMRIFGSVACGMANDNSDIDLLADYKPECKLSLFDVARLEIELTDLLQHKTDLVFSTELKDRVANHIFRNEITWVC
jgi:predicted nucleotidyltransferase